MRVAIFISIFFLWVGRAQVCEKNITPIGSGTALQDAFEPDCGNMYITLLEGIFEDETFSVDGQGKNLTLIGVSSYSIFRKGNINLNNFGFVTIRSIAFQNSFVQMNFLSANIVANTFNWDTANASPGITSQSSNITFNYNSITNFASTGSLTNSALKCIGDPRSTMVIQNSYFLDTMTTSIANVGCTMRIQDCIFTGSITTSSGLRIQSGTNTLYNCSFSDHLYGVYTALEQISGDRITNCTFTGNAFAIYSKLLISTNNSFLNNVFAISNYGNGSQDSLSRFINNVNGISSGSNSSFTVIKSMFDSNGKAILGVVSSIFNVLNSTFINCKSEMEFQESTFTIIGSRFSIQTQKPLYTSRASSGQIIDSVIEQRQAGPWNLSSFTNGSIIEFKNSVFQFNNISGSPLGVPLLRLQLFNSSGDFTENGLLFTPKFDNASMSNIITMSESQCRFVAIQGLPMGLRYNESIISIFSTDKRQLVLQNTSVANEVQKAGGPVQIPVTDASRDFMLGYSIYLDDTPCEISGNVLVCLVGGIDEPYKYRYIKHCAASFQFRQGPLPPVITEAYVLNGLVTLIGKFFFVPFYATVLSPNNISICVAGFTSFNTNQIKCLYNPSAGTQFRMSIDDYTVNSTLIIRKPLEETISKVFEEYGKTNTSITVLINQAIGNFFGNFTGDNNSFVVKSENITLAAVKITDMTAEDVQVFLDANIGASFPSSLIEELDGEALFATIYVLTNRAFSFANTTPKSPPNNQQIYALSLLDARSNEVEVQNSSEAISIKMTPSFNSTAPDTKVECIYWVEQLMMWSSEGCRVGEVREGVVECLCNHLTNFTLSTSRTLPQQPPTVTEKGNQTGLIVGVVVGVIGALIVVGIIAFLIIRMRKRGAEGVKEFDLSQMVQMNNLDVGDKIKDRNHLSLYSGLYQSTTHVTVKVLEKQKEEQRLLNEISIMKQVHHPNIVQFLGVATFNQKPAFVIESFNMSLRDYLERKSKNENSLLQIAKEVLSALSYLSEVGIVHGLVRSESVVLRGEGNIFTAKLEDFSCSNDSKTKASECPSIRWTAPEVLKGEDASGSSDMWSFGILLWEMFHHNQVPYGKLSEKEAKDSIIRGNKLEISEEVPLEVNKMMVKCWEEAKMRPKPHELVASLNNILPSEEEKNESFQDDVYIDSK